MDDSSSVQYTWRLQVEDTSVISVGGMYSTYRLSIGAY